MIRIKYYTCNALNVDIEPYMQSVGMHLDL